MNYKKYIELGFKRYDLNCSVEFDQTGYKGFSLEKDVNDKLRICVISGELDKPMLYIKKRNEDTYHIVDISFEVVLDLLSITNYEEENFTKAC